MPLKKLKKLLFAAWIGLVLVVPALTVQGKERDSASSAWRTCT